MKFPGVRASLPIKDTVSPVSFCFLEFWFSAGKLPTKTVGEPGTQGATIAGIQGCGFSTPGGGAAVAAATAGLAVELHIPKGKILLSIMLATGWVGFQVYKNSRKYLPAIFYGRSGGI